ncbi:MAG: M14 metallopeptidase family protein [Bacteroidota bacterium]
MFKYILLLFAWSWQLFSQTPADSTIPTPKQVLGYELGDRFTQHSGIEKYLFAVRDAAPNRMKLFPYGKTFEGRMLYIAVFGSPENLSRLDEIKTAIHKLADPRIVTSGDVDDIVKNTPAIVWLSYGVHGNEASSSEAALNVIYQLASRNDQELISWLHNLIIVVDPLLNPDGHERYVNYEITHTGASPVLEKAAVEHNEDWPSGRTNHYYFDLNRDWAWMTQPETKARIKIYQEWKPQVVVDFHEMGYNSSYFFFPPVRPVNKNFPKSTMTWADIFGKANAAAFDAQGLNYWSGESFDLFYPGYGDSWPTFSGAIGMTYEQGGQTGVRVMRNDETILTLKDRLNHHSLTSFATIKAASEHRETRLRDFYQFFKDAIDEGKSGNIKSFIIDPAKDPARAAKMVSLLRKQGIEVEKSTKEFSLDKVSTYFTKNVVSKSFPAGSYILSLNQPAKRLIMALMEQEPVLSDTFFYDISTWTLPVAYGVPAYWTGKSFSIQTEKVSGDEFLSGSVTSRAAYAYLMKWNSNEAMKALSYLLQNNYRANVAMQAFQTGGEQFSRGTIIIPVAGNPADIHTRMNEVAQKFGVTIYGENSGYTEHGINLGSDKMVRVKKPKILVITGQPVSSESYGAIWAMFDLQYEIQFVPMKISQLRSVDLHDYTAIIFPDDNSGGNGYKSQIDSSMVEKLKAWIRGGGTFIGLEGGAAFASASVGKLSSVKIKEEKKDDDKKKDEKKDTQPSKEELEKRMTVEERQRKNRLEEIPGTIVRVKLDVSHPLGFGYDTTINVFKTSSTMFELSDHGYNVGIYPSSPRLSGYMSAENEKKLEGTAYLVHEQLGGGNIILFADDPNFRLFWDGLNKIFLNSVLLMPGIRNVTLTAEGD